MENQHYIKIADDISNKLISIWKNNQVNGKSIIELYRELLDSKYLEQQTVILSYIPGCLAAKGYEIGDSSYFELKKY